MVLTLMACYVRNGVTAMATMPGVEGATTLDSSGSFDLLIGDSLMETPVRGNDGARRGWIPVRRPGRLFETGSLVLNRLPTPRGSYEGIIDNWP